jgi:hypothetical protein
MLARSRWAPLDRASWAVAALSVALLLHATALHGPGLGFDSAQFISAADGLREGAGLLRVDGTPYDLWTPLQACLLALPLELGVPPGSAALVINALSLFLLVVLTARMAAAIAPGAGLFAALALVSSADLLWIEAQLLAEPVFMALAAATVVATQWHARRPTGMRLALVSACGALTALQRYDGVTLIASTAAALLARPVRDPVRLRAGRAALFALIASLPLALWMLRNLLLVGTPTGQRGAWGTGLGALWFLRRIGIVTQDWFFPGGWSAPRLALLAAAGALLAAVLVRSRRELRAGWGPALAPALFVLVYGLFSWVVHASVDIDGIGPRQIATFLPFLWALLAGGALALLRAAQQRSRLEGGLLTAALAGAFAVHLFDSSVNVARHLPLLREKIRPFAYNLPMWEDDELWSAVRARAGAGPILSNDPELVYVKTRLRNQPCGGSRGGVRRIARELAAAGTSGTLVWVPHNELDILPMDVMKRLVLEPVASTAKGTVYAFRPAESTR